MRHLLALLCAAALVGAATEAQAAPRWRWRQLQPAHAPPPSFGHRMVYDPARQRVVLLGGVSCCASLEQGVWEWDGDDWIQGPASPQPSPVRWMGAAAYDASGASTVYFGGKSPSDTALNDTWRWDGSQWSELPAGGGDPGVRWRAAALGAGAEHGVFLLQGALSQGSLNLSSMARFKEGAWSSLAVLPPSRVDLGAFWSTSLQEAFAFGGRSCAGGASCAVWPELHTWKPTDAAWQVSTPAGGPEARWGAIFAAHEEEQQGILLGGQGVGGLISESSDPAQTATWFLDLKTRAWSKSSELTLPARVHGAAVWDEARRYVLLFGGSSDASDPQTYDQLGAIPAPALFGDTWVLERLGDPCAGEAECATGACVDGVCCEQVCGPCQRCDAAGQEGLCSPVLSAKDPDSCPVVCGPDGVCQATLGAPGAPCQSGEECATGACVDGVCCEQASCGACERCEGGGVCVPVLAAADPDSCATSCNGGGICEGEPGKANGATCINGASCESGFCVDGICCSAACSSPCDSCRVASGAPQDGVCGARACPGLERCNEARGGCVGGAVPLYGACTEGADCESGVCLDQRCCSPGDPSCGFVCEDARTSLDTSSGARRSCGEEEVCFQGRCVGPPRCSPEVPCPGTLLVCNGEGRCVAPPGGRSFDQDTPISCICQGAGAGREASGGAAGLLALAGWAARRRARRVT
jgi:hypothetical protein